MSEQEPVDRFGGVEAASVVDPDLWLGELADRLICGSRARRCWPSGSSSWW